MIGEKYNYLIGSSRPLNENFRIKVHFLHRKLLQGFLHV